MSVSIRTSCDPLIDADIYPGGFNVRPRHFECDINVRSPQHEEILRNGYQGALKVVSKYPLFKEDAVAPV